MRHRCIGYTQTFGVHLKRGCEILGICSGEMNSAFTLCVASLGCSLFYILCVLVMQLLLEMIWLSNDVLFIYFGWLQAQYASLWMNSFILSGRFLLCRRSSWGLRRFLLPVRRLLEKQQKLQRVSSQSGTFQSSKTLETCTVVKDMSSCLDFCS